MGVLMAAILGLTAMSLAAASMSQPEAAPPDLANNFATAEPGKTTVGVQVARADTGAISFEVPLYMTAAVVNGAGGVAEVLCPTTYSILNLSTAPDGTKLSAAVTGLAVQGAAGGTWSLRQTPTQGKEIALNIGGVQLPNVDAGNRAFTYADLKARDSKFYDSAAGKYRSISAQPGGTALALSGAVMPGFSVTTDAGTAAQFRCVYTVSLLDKSGNAIGVFYDGPEKDAATTP